MLQYPNDEPFGLTCYEYRTDQPSKRSIGFSPLMNTQRYVSVKEVIRKLAERTTVSTVAEYGSNTFTFFLYHLLECSSVDLVHQIDIDENRIYSAMHVISTERERRFLRIEGRKPLVVNIFHGNVAEKDDRLLNTDVVVGIELIEHLEQTDFDKFPENIFGFMKPKLVVLTTPNRDFNVLFEFEEGKKFRHDDHKFEFTRQEFQNWANDIVEEYPLYSVQIYGIGEPPEDCTLDVGFCSQMAIFERLQFSETSYELTQPVNNYTLIGSYSYFTFETLSTLGGNITDAKTEKCKRTARRKRKKIANGERKDNATSRM